LKQYIFPVKAIHVLIIFLPAGLFLIMPLPPTLFAARLFAAVIRPPLLVFAIFFYLHEFFEKVRSSFILF
jgi:hypothetical protein